MSSKRSGNNIICSRYASALLEAAEEKGVVAKVEADFAKMEELFAKSEEFVVLVKNPVLKRAQRIEIIDSMSKIAGFNELTKGFLVVLAKNGRLMLLDGMIKAFFAERNKREGCVTAHVSATQDLSAAQKKSLEKGLSDSSGLKVSLEVGVDESLIGGMKIILGSLLVDNTVSRKLELMRSNLKKNGANTTKEVA